MGPGGAGRASGNSLPLGPRVPLGRANFNAESVAPSGKFPPNRWGLFDMVGRRWEWIEDGQARGGSWAERDPNLLRIDHVQKFPAGYEGEDVSFRLLWVPD